MPVWKDKIASFPLSSKFVQKLGELSEQASKRKPETEVANKYNNNTRVTAACTKLVRLLTEVFCYGWSSVWNLKVEAYGNKSKKNWDIEELLEEVADVAPQGVDTKALKGRLSQSPSHDLDIFSGSRTGLGSGVFTFFNFLSCLYIVPLPKLLVSRLVASLAQR